VNADDVPVRPVAVRVRRFQGSVLVGRADDAFELTESAAFVFRHVDGARTVRDIGELLAAHYDIDPAMAVADTAELLEDLAGSGIVELADRPARPERVADG
jgi:pyrroloquinoline quinone biosynthesis protein D